MSDKYIAFIGKWIHLDCKLFTCNGKIEKITENSIILSDAVLSNAKIRTKFVGIDVNLIENIEYLSHPFNVAQNVSQKHTPTKLKCVNVFTSPTQPPFIKRGGSSSAVDRTIVRQNQLHNENYSENRNHNLRKDSITNKSIEPAWMNFPSNELDTNFDFDKNLALFDKNCVIKNKNRKNRNESSDSSDSIGVKVHPFLKDVWINGQSIRSRCHKLSFNFDDTYPNDSKLWSCEQVSESQYGFDMDSKKTFGRYLPSGSGQQPDLVREVTQSRQLKVQNCNSSQLLRRTSVISINGANNIFNDFNEFWNLGNDFVFPVFTIKQRDRLFEAANQLGIESSDIETIVGETLSEFIITQVGGPSRLNSVREIPKIAILLGLCSASVYVSRIAKCLHKKGCHILVYVDDNKISDVNYKMDLEIRTLQTLLKNDFEQGCNFFTYDIQDLYDKTFDYVISGVESDTCDNNPNDLLKIWCSNQRSHILCVNPPNISRLKWKSAVFVGVPTFSHQNLAIKLADPSVSSIHNRSSQLTKSHRKPDGLILLCNVNFPGNVFSFLKLQYNSPFKSKNWIRLYHDSDLCVVE